MLDRNTRMRRIQKRISQYHRRYENRQMAGLSVLCLLLTGGMGKLLVKKQQPGRFTIHAEYGSVLLSSNGEPCEPYIVIGVLAFLAGAALTILCIRLNRWIKRKGMEEENE